MEALNEKLTDGVEGRGKVGRRVDPYLSATLLPLSSSSIIPLSRLLSQITYADSGATAHILQMTLLPAVLRAGWM